eukprot:3247059-Prymnesium_polylepis.1
MVGPRGSIHQYPVVQATYSVCRITCADRGAPGRWHGRSPPAAILSFHTTRFGGGSEPYLE